ncbi:hypothetical protein LCGC14_1271350, partial [marine sediment metagenome]
MRYRSAVILSSKYLVLLLITLIACTKDIGPEDLDPEPTIKDKIGGYVQKGPFINGTAVVISELDSSLNPTGRNFNTQIVDNKGTFEIRDIELFSNYVELRTDGFYFNEIEGQKSAAQLTLFALADVSNQSSINVNILTHLEKSRVVYLIGDGLSFSDAKAQAQSEVLNIFGVDGTGIDNSETLDISQPGEENALLMAISVILQGNRTVADLTEIMANISTDIREDGILNSKSTFDSLYEQAYSLNLQEIRTNITNRYESIGVNASIGNFENYIIDFLNPFEITHESTPASCNGES